MGSSDGRTALDQKQRLEQSVFSTQEEAENAMERWDTMARKDKYFIVTKGTDRAIMRSDRKRALEKKAELLERFPDKEVYIYRAKGKEEDV